MSLFINELVEENARLKEEIDNLYKERNKLIEEIVLYRSLFKKHKKAIEIIKEKSILFISKGVCDIGNYYELNSLDRDKDITKKEYELLKEMFGDE